MRKYRAQNEGFTLIELLVVVAIIALLSTIVLSALDTSREKARNTKRNEMALQYINALELYRSEHDSYPNVGTGVYCIGYSNSASETCQGGSRSGNDDLITALETYLPGPPKNDDPINYLTYELSGTTYECVDISCNKYKLWWYLEGSNDQVSCVRGATLSETPPPYCNYENYEN